MHVHASDFLTFVLRRLAFDEENENHYPDPPAEAFVIIHSRVHRDDWWKEIYPTYRTIIPIERNSLSQGRTCIFYSSLYVQVFDEKTRTELAITKEGCVISPL